MPTDPQPIPVVWSRVRGRSGADSPAELPPDMAAEAINVRFRRGTLGEKRYGASRRTLTGTFSGFNVLANFVPGQNDAAAELHFVDRTATTKILRVAAGTAAAALTLADAVSALPQSATWAVLNGKLYWAYTSGVNRLHVFDPATSTTVVRRVGLPLPAAPTVADSAVGGAYTAIPRIYRVRWLALLAGRTQRLSDSVTASGSFTPFGGWDAAVVTRPTAPGEGETHWRVEASADGGSTWYIVSGAIAIATTTYRDTTLPPLYADGTAAPEIGAHTPPPSAKFLASLGDRLLMFGCRETAPGDSLLPHNGRLHFSPVLGTSLDNSDDDERVSNTLTVKGWIDAFRDSGAEDRALVVSDGAAYTFHSRGICKFTLTGNSDVPLRRRVLSTSLGAVSQESTFEGEDEQGRPCIYFIDPSRGFYRYGAEGFQWIGYDVRDKWKIANLEATGRVAHGVFNGEDRQVHYWIATNSSNDPDLGLIFHVREGQPTVTEGVRYGWALDTGDAAGGRCSVMFAQTFGATMSRKRSPYVGTAAKLLRTEDPAATDDDSATFAGSVLSKAWGLEPDEAQKEVIDAWLRARVNAGVTIRQTLIPNFGDQASRTDDQTLDPLGAEARVLKRFESAALQNAYTFQVQLGDAAASTAAWQLDRWRARVLISGEHRGNIL